MNIEFHTTISTKVTDSRTMDGLWDPPNYQVPEETNCGTVGCQCALGLAYDGIEEMARNEQSCIEVLRILISKADTDILELEEELVELLSQLACTVEKNSDMEPVESIHDILKSLLCPYSQKKDEQFEDNTSKVASSSYVVRADNPSGKKKQIGSSSNVNQMERSKRDIINELEKHTISQTRVKTEEENANYPETNNDFGVPSLSKIHCTSLVSKLSAPGLCQGSMEKMNKKVNELQIEGPRMTKDILQNMTLRCNSVCQKSSVETRGKWKHQPKMIKCQSEDEVVEEGRELGYSISPGARTRNETRRGRVVANDSEEVAAVVKQESACVKRRRQVQKSSCSTCCLVVGGKELSSDYYTVDDLKAIARQRKMKGYSKLRKSELAWVLGIKVTEGKKKPKRKEAVA